MLNWFTVPATWCGERHPQRDSDSKKTPRHTQSAVNAGAVYWVCRGCISAYLVVNVWFGGPVALTASLRAVGGREVQCALNARAALQERWDLSGRGGSAHGIGEGIHSLRKVTEQRSATPESMPKAAGWAAKRMTASWRYPQSCTRQSRGLHRERTQRGRSERRAAQRRRQGGASCMDTEDSAGGGGRVGD